MATAFLRGGRLIPVSATIITYNEERNIRACLESVAWLPHIVVVDSGSTDATVDIAREFTDHIIVTDWPGHVAQKNRAVDAAPTDWVLSLDADERVTPEMRAAIEEKLAFGARRSTCVPRWVQSVTRTTTPCARASSPPSSARS